MHKKLCEHLVSPSQEMQILVRDTMAMILTRTKIFLYSYSRVLSFEVVLLLLAIISHEFTNSIWRIQIHTPFFVY